MASSRKDIAKKKRSKRKPSGITVVPKAKASGYFGMDRVLPKRPAQIIASYNKLPSAFKSPGVAMDTAVTEAMDNSIGQVKQYGTLTGVVPNQVLGWYSQFGFIGWQISAIMSQQWLVNKALTMPGKDAVRHGFERTTTEDVKLDDEIAKLIKLDKGFRLKKNLTEFSRNTRLFGIRHILFLVDGIDYEKPFNPDGIKPGSYKGMTQIDPYWLAPELSLEDATDSAGQHFYEPTWWRVNGKRVHRSHFVISRNGNDLPDLLKPSYYYGGISTTQLIYERVYAAERTANESPMLMMSKRLFTLKVDTSQAAADLNKFEADLRQWTDFMNNFGVKVIGGEEEVQLHDTNLSGIDEVIMNQYQLVAAVAEVPATKLLGTSPKGFNATGDYEMDTYHEFLESLQEDELTPIVERHTLCCQRSEQIAVDTEFEISWNPVDVLSAKDQADINLVKANTDSILADKGAIDGYDIRKRLVADPDSGYNGIEEIVPDGPGDREAMQNAEGPLEMPVNAEGKVSQRDTAEDKLDCYPVLFDGAQVLSHQSYINPAIVAQKVRDQDYVVNVTPKFIGEDGKAYRMVLDGHHSLTAAIQEGEEPIFVEGLPIGVVKT